LRLTMLALFLPASCVRERATAADAGPVPPRAESDSIPTLPEPCIKHVERLCSLNQPACSTVRSVVSGARPDSERCIAEQRHWTIVEQLREYGGPNEALEKKLQVDLLVDYLERSQTLPREQARRLLDQIDELSMRTIGNKNAGELLRMNWQIDELRQTIAKLAAEVKGSDDPCAAFGAAVCHTDPPNPEACNQIAEIVEKAKAPADLCRKKAALLEKLMAAAPPELVHLLISNLLFEFLEEAPGISSEEVQLMRERMEEARQRALERR